MLCLELTANNELLELLYLELTAKELLEQLCLEQTASELLEMLCLPKDATICLVDKKKYSISDGSRTKPKKNMK